MEELGGAWILDENSTIKFENSDGSIVDHDALDIWSAEYEGRVSVRGHLCNRPSTDLPDLEISADLLQLQPTLLPFEAGLHYVALRAVNAKNKPYLDSWPNSDQVLIGQQWFAVDREGLSRLRDELEKHGIELLEEITEEMELWLLWHSGLDVVRLDDQRNVSVAKRRSSPIAQHSLNAELYPYQAAGLAKLVSMTEQGLGCLLADEMGLGKTLQAIGVIAWTVERGEAPCLVITPSSTTANWKRELARFAPSLRTYEHSGPARTGSPTLLADFDVVVTSFDVMIRDEYLLRSMSWSTVVIDEAQNIKNPQTQRSKVIRNLTAKSIITITGTPIENSLRDLWSIMSIVAPNYLSSLDEFCSKFPDEIEAASELGYLVAPLIIRRRVADVANDLPARTDAFVPIHTSGTIAREYERIRQDTSIPALAKIGYLRQACSSLRCLDLESPAITTDNPKYEHALQIISDAFSFDCKVLVFASYKSTIDEITDDLRRRFDFAYVGRLDGTIAISERQQIIDEFTKYSGAGVLVMNPKAAGVGLNIQAANYVIHFTPEWNPATIDQASARSHRRGQGKPVFVYSLYYVNTVEEAMLERVGMKRELSKSGLSGSEARPSQGELQEMIAKSIYGGD